MTFALRQLRSDRNAIYDAIAPKYDRLHARFLRLAGGEAQAALDAACLMAIRPGFRVLDAGCGTGALARKLLRQAPDIDLTLLDGSAPMLRQTRGLAARRTFGSLTALPHADGTFDLSLAAWVLETVSDPHCAIAELARVTRRRGHIGLAFCSSPETGDLVGRAVLAAMGLRGTGRPLDPGSVVSSLRETGCGQVIHVPVRGPATVLMARREDD